MITELHADEIEDLPATRVFVKVGLCESHNDAVRCAKQGGLRIGDEILVAPGDKFPLFLKGGCLTSALLRRGKKKRCLLNISWEGVQLVRIVAI